MPNFSSLAGLEWLKSLCGGVGGWGWFAKSFSCTMEDGFGPFHPATSTLLPLEFFLADKTIPGGLVGGQYMTVLYIISSLIS